MNMRRTLLSLRSKRVKGEKLNQSISASFLSTTATPTSYPIHQRYETSIFELHNQPPQKIRSIIDELEKFTPTKTKKYGRSSELNVLLKQMVAEKAQSNVTKKGSKSAEGLRSVIVNNITSQVMAFLQIYLNLLQLYGLGSITCSMVTSKPNY